ncbi:MAG: type II toxin-antitoxin system VapC family toxin [Prochloraceae cyanobacterium]|nr:type II toxin-antitoxin system VapC family toxin [Prochloraceae cyanobacterium]
MIYLLDTNACMVYLNKKLSGVRQRLETLSPSDIAVCSVVKAEIFYAGIRTNNPQNTLRMQQEFFDRFLSLPFDDRAARIYSQIRATLMPVGSPIGPYDLQIASIAIAYNLVLVTSNMPEYSRVRELLWENWQESFS